MIKAQPAALRHLVSTIFTAAGCEGDEADCISDHLVLANLSGHDSHGVIRVPIYIRWLEEGKVHANQHIGIVFQNEVIAVVDGQLGFGQSIGQQAVDLGLQKCAHQGVAIVALRNSGHLGRIGHWAEMAAEDGMVSLHFVNTTGLGMLVAPVGGRERRLSANPLAIGIPVENDDPIVLDISTSSIAEGKLKVAFNKGVPVPDGCIIDAQGQPTNDPRAFYADPPGALLPFGGHKGYGLGFVTEILSGALTGSGCTRPGKTQLEQGMLSIIVDPSRFVDATGFFAEIREFVEFVKTSEKTSDDAQILVPGEIEQQTRAARGKGIELDDTTWSQLAETARGLEVDDAKIDAVVIDE